MRALKIVNACIPDYNAECFQFCDILIDGGKILKLEKAGNCKEETVKTIDAEGKVVSSGFIDIHAHEDAPNEEFFTSRCCLRMGVTTKIAGNCGENYDNLDNFIMRVNNGSPTNYMMFIGQNTLREMVGANDRYASATEAQINEMKAIIKELLKYEPLGLSCGFEYAPGVTVGETVELIKAFERKKCMVSVHFRSDGPEAVKSTEELLEICDKSGCAMQMSHIGSCSAVGYMRETIDVLEKGRDRGVDIMADCYPYNAFCTGIGTAVFDEGAFEKWNYSDLMITDGKYKGQRCTKEIFEEVRRETPEMYVVAFVMNEDEIELAYKQPYVLIGSDCGYINDSGHPRGSGTYPKILGYYVRERKVMTLIDALKKMTMLPAKRVNLAAKGEVKENFDADLVIFDKDVIADQATFENPTLPPKGISYVIINGEIAVEDNKIVNDKLGRYIPYQSSLA